MLLFHITLLLFITTAFGQNKITDKAGKDLAKGKYTAVVKALENLLSSDMENEMGYLYLGTAYLRLGRKDQTIEAWRNAFRYDENGLIADKLTSAVVELLDTLKKGKDLREQYLITARTTEIFSDHSPSNPALLWMLATAHDNLNNYDKAQKEYLKVLQIYINDEKLADIELAAKACYKLADDFWFRLRNKKKALQFIDQGISLSNDNADLMMLGALLRADQDSTSTQKLYEDLLLKVPNKKQLVLRYARFTKESDPYKSMELYQQLLDLKWEMDEALYSLGLLYTQEASKIQTMGGDPKQVLDMMQVGINFLERLYKRNPNDSLAKSTLVRLYRTMNMDDKAKALENR